MCQGFWFSSKPPLPSYLRSMKNKFKPIAIAAIPIKTAYTVLTTFDSVRRIQNESQIIHTAQERMPSQFLENTAERKNSTLTIFIPFSEHIASNIFCTAFILLSYHSMFMLSSWITNNNKLLLILLYTKTPETDWISRLRSSKTTRIRSLKA